MRPPTAVTNAVQGTKSLFQTVEARGQEAAGEFRSFALRSWRSDGIKHKKNEIFLDVARGPGSEVRSELVAWFVSFSVQGGAPQSPGFCKRVCSAFGDLGGIEDEATLLLIACVCAVCNVK